MEWDLLSPAAVAAAAGRTSVPAQDHRASLIAVGPRSLSTTRWAGGSALVPIPEDIEQVRAQSPQLAQRWRVCVREVLDDAMSRGAVIAGFDRQRGYLISHPSEPNSQ